MPGLAFRSLAFKNAAFCVCVSKPTKIELQHHMMVDELGQAFEADAEEEDAKMASLLCVPLAKVRSWKKLSLGENFLNKVGPSIHKTKGFIATV